MSVNSDMRIHSHGGNSMSNMLPSSLSSIDTLT